MLDIIDKKYPKKPEVEYFDFKGKRGEKLTGGVAHLPIAIAYGIAPAELHAKCLFVDTQYVAEIDESPNQYGDGKHYQIIKFRKKTKDDQ